MRSVSEDGLGPSGKWRVRRDTAEGAQCPVRDVLDRIGDAWSALIVLILDEQGTRRFNALKREIGDVSQRMLAVTLRQLERDGLVERTVRPTKPPQVEYALTPTGHSFAARMRELTNWANAHHDAIRQARAEFDARADAH